MTKEKMTKLLDCPFCGGEPTLSKEGKLNIDYHIFCTQCGIVSKRYYDEVDAVEQWNTRPKKVSVEEIRDIVAQAWCFPRNSEKIFDPELAEDITQAIAERVNR